MTSTVDLLIVGGGVNGVGIARDAAGRGYRVTLLEAEDLAGATSSASSKLIHGGLRYLEQYDFRLVHESLKEREVLLHAAPHLVWPLRFVLPHHAELRPAWMLRTGLFIYDHLGGRQSLPGTRTLDLARCPEGAPLREGFKRGFAYSDCWADDARLVAVCAVDAADRGARILTRTRFVDARRDADAWNVEVEGPSGRETLRARAVVNAAGPWVEAVLRATGRNAPSTHSVRLIKGSHIVVPALYPGAHCYTLQSGDGRVVFTIPYEGRFTLVGTTDQAFEGDPRTAAISAEETDYLRGVVAQYFRRPIALTDVVWSYAGVRPLADSRQEKASAVTRDYAFDLDTAGGAPLLSIFGGKLTTFRKLAEHALRDLGQALGETRAPWTTTAILPGGAVGAEGFDAFVARTAARWPWLDAAVAHRLARAYGTRIDRVIGDAASWDDMGADYGAGLTEREAGYLRAEEWARTAQDVLWRRSKRGLHMTALERDAFTAAFEASGRA